MKIIGLKVNYQIKKLEELTMEVKKMADGQN